MYEFQTFRRRNGAVLAAALGVLLLAGSSRIQAEEGPKLTFGSAVKEIKIGGDLRLRQENFWKRQSTDRSRQRFRLRIGTEFALPYNLKAKMRFASGTGEQVSTNQSFDNLSSQKEFWIDQAYLEWKILGDLVLAGGRTKNYFWLPYASDLVWDGDYNPEGFSQSYKGSLFGMGRYFVNALQMVADEDSGSQDDQWMFGEQLGLIVPVPGDSRLTIAGALYQWVNESTTTERNNSASSLSQAATNEGNRRNGSNLANDFHVMHLAGELLVNRFPLPISIQGAYIKNLDAVDAYNPKEDTGWQAGLIVGKAAKKGTWEVAYFRKSVETDATVADVADSDWGDGGTNRKGHISWIGYAPADFVTLTAKLFNTKVLNEQLSPGKDDINRLQLDVAVKF